MVDRARLTPPRPRQENWRWHEATVAAVSVAKLSRGDRRMEAASYLDPGYATRIAITSKSSGWLELSEVARVWQPSRLKGIQVAPEHGTPFLSATQVFAERPTARKWLAADRTPNAEQRLIPHGTILTTCSGNVGRTTIAHSRLSGAFISHDLLRLEPRAPGWRGWIYAYLLAPSVRGLLQAAQYGHVIKHLETSHLDGMPIIEIDGESRASFETLFQEVLRRRDEAFDLRDQAEQLLGTALGVERDGAKRDLVVFAASSRDLLTGRRRLDASYYSPAARDVLASIANSKCKTESLGELCSRVWWETRFARVFGSTGAPYMSSDELFSIDLPSVKRVKLEPIERPERFFAEAGWLLLACSGQTYGINGSVALMTRQHEEYFFSHDLIRLAPKAGRVDPGYLFAYLGHPTIGYPLLIRLAYGSSIPHLDPADVSSVPVARLNPSLEKEIGQIASQSAELHQSARELEGRMAQSAEDILQAFIAGRTFSSFARGALRLVQNSA